MTRLPPSNTRSTVLIVSSCWWPFPARLAMAFGSIGHRVEAVCPAHHPLMKTTAVQTVHRYNALRPVAALAKSIAKADPALIVPCDDRAVVHLHAVLAAFKDTAPAIAAVIKRSLGNIDSFAVADHRAALIAAAQSEGISAPDMMPVETSQQLTRAIATLGLPIVLKNDGSWGGLGVRIARSPEEAGATLRSLSRPVSVLRALKRLVVDRDPFWIGQVRSGTRPTVNAQRFVPGTPANSAVACWNGEVLACICVVAVRTRGDRGASTVVRIVDNPQMLKASTTLVRRLGLSGFCGFDFVLADADGTAHLIEMNARSTPISHLSLGEGRNLVVALARRLDGVPALAPTPSIAQNLVAFFPQAWLLEPHSDLLNSSYHDVPWGEQALVRELMKRPWPERSLLARLAARIRRASNSDPVSTAPVHYAGSPMIDFSARS